MSTRPPLTHFLCIPLITNASRPQFERSLRQFRVDLSSHPFVARFADSRAVRPIGSIHLTLGVMSLTSPERVLSAKNYLSSLDVVGMLRDVASEMRPEDKSGKSSSLQPPSQTEVTDKSHCLRLTVKGLEARPPAHQTTVLWVPISHPLLLRFCLRLRKQFQDAGYIVSETRPLKLHATLLNTIYFKGKNNSRRSRDIAIDATRIVEEMRHRTWADDFILDRVAICEMGAQQIKNIHGHVIDEAYKEVAIKKLPTK